MERKKSTTEEEIEIIPVIIDGKKYLTFPQCQIFTGMKREVLRQRMSHKKLPFFTIKPNYVFIPYDACVQIIEGEVKDKKTEKIKQAFTVEQLNKILLMKEGKIDPSEIKDILGL